ALRPRTHRAIRNAPIEERAMEKRAPAPPPEATRARSSSRAPSDGLAEIDVLFDPQGEELDQIGVGDLRHLPQPLVDVGVLQADAAVVELEARRIDLEVAPELVGSADEAVSGSDLAGRIDDDELAHRPVILSALIVVGRGAAELAADDHEELVEHVQLAGA